MELSRCPARCDLVAILRGIRPEEAVPLTAESARRGVGVIAVPLNSADPLANITALAQAGGL